MQYEIVIGLEVHSQLATASKMFCSCEADYQEAEPNSIVCEVCMGMPGVLPVINRRAVEFVIATGLALDCTISKYTKFDRKNYPYPDLMKGYQISQYDQPIASNGSLTINVEDSEKAVGITRVHLEEDVAKLIHHQGLEGDGYSLVDVNRSGVPLMEIVSEPDIRTPEQARSYLISLRAILQYLGVSTANMEEGSFRCDANISIRPFGSNIMGSKVEVKNMNSFRSVFSALVYESERQIGLARQDQRIEQETRGWVDDRGITVSQRTKEYAADYRYFPEPDLPPVAIESTWIERVKDRLPELPEVKKNRFIEQYGLSEYDSQLLTASKSTADFFESVLRGESESTNSKSQFAKAVSNWMLGELTRLLNVSNTEIKDLKIRPEHILEILDLIDGDILSTSMARTVFEEMFDTGRSPRQIVEESDMAQISDAESVQPAVDEVVESNPDAVADYLGGKETAIRFLVGQVMRVTNGKANPQLVGTLINAKMESLR